MAAFASRKTSVQYLARGFSLLEMVVVVVCIGILAGVALERLLPLIGKAERVAFIRVQGQLQNAIMLETAQRLARGESRRLSQMLGSNPMDYVLQPPANYLGSFDSPRHADVPAGHWYFDSGRGRLVYRVGDRDRFESDGGPEDRVEFAVQLAFRDENGNGAFDPRGDILDGVWLRASHSYRWAE